MAFTCDPTTRAELNAAPNKLQWTVVLNAALGTTRRIRCKRDANANAADPWATGVEFRNVGSTGTIKTVAGKVKSLGRIKGSTISLPADVSTGASVLRVEGNGRWIQGSLGPTGDFVSGNFTATNGLSIKPDFAISGPRLLPSGTGPAAPALDANAPNKFEVWNWSNPNSPALAGTVVLNNRIDDFVYEDAELAALNGDVGVYQSTQSAIHGNHEFGFTLLASHKGNTEANVEPLYQVIGSVAHRGTWTSYPFRDTYDQANHVLYPDPFKVVMKNAAGTVLHTFEMRDGLAINDPSLSQSQTDVAPLRPHFNCFMALPWQNTRPKMSTKAGKYYTGLHPNYQRPSIAKTHYSFIAVEPMMTGRYERNSRNGLHTPWSVDQWPRPNVDWYPAVGDPYMVNQNTVYPPHAQTVDGYGYEPGSFSTHNWYNGPGGPRHDRSVIATTLAKWATDPTGVRLQDNVPLRDMADGFLFGYFNHSNKWVSDPKTLKLVDDSRITGGELSMAGVYYGDFPNSAANQVYVAGNKDDVDRPIYNDKTGRLICSGWARDPLHSYANAGWGALLLNSPLMAVASKFDATTQMMLHPSPQNNVLREGYYLIRTQAWDWFHHVMAWKLASTHNLGFSRAAIEARFVVLLENLWTYVYKPTFIDNDQSMFCEGIRRFGMTVVYNPQGSNDWANGSPGGQLAFYMTHVLALMKQTGMWSVLQAKGGKVKQVLDMQIRNMDKWCFERLVNTRYSRMTLRGFDSGGNENPDNGYTMWPTTDPMPADWAAYSATYESPLSDYTHKDDGSPRSGDRDVSDHCFMAYPYMRRDFFPEITHALLAQAVAKVDSYQGQIATNVASGADPVAKRGYDFTYGYPGVAAMKAPTELGPA